MSEHQDHVRQSLEGQNVDPSEDLGIDAMRWTPAPTGNTVPDATTTAAIAEAHALLDQATNAFLALVDLLEDGDHRVVAVASTPQGELTECQELTVIGDAVVLDEAEALRVTVTVAAAMVACSTGSVVVRTSAPNGVESVRGWAVRHGWLRPLREPEIRQAYTVDAETGAPLDPPPDLEFRQAERVPRLEAEGGYESASHTAPRDNRPPNQRN
ncbi:hypothetical protein ABZT17_10190 [Streptomyces sp. NPDC005648]|uniref:hypothetical protein n=1 Tax=Streptomyces sp. NPDC005648 TaxID=3157044 RepID=UPI0033BECF3F